MIVTQLLGGLGNQFFQYAAGRCLAHRLNTELKIYLGALDKNLDSHARYRLDEFNIVENIASEEEMQRVKANNYIEEPPYGFNMVDFIPAVMNSPNNTYLAGFWQSEKYFIEIADIIRREFTLKAIGKNALKWLEKIRNAECTVSLHVRRGDYLSSWTVNLFGAMPLVYYYDCIDSLKKFYPRMTIFIFSDGIDWGKRNLMFDMPTEFVEGCERDVDEMFLMSQCRHNIISNSTFSWWGAWLNPRPDKKIFAPAVWLRKHGYNTIIIPDSWTKMPVDYTKYPNIEANHELSIVICVKNDADAIADCLSSVLNQSSPHFEVIIIDDASTDHSGAICRRAADLNDKVRCVSLNRSVGRSAAFNLGLDLARNAYIIFIDGRKRIANTTVEMIYNITASCSPDIFHSGTNIDAEFRVISGLKGIPALEWIANHSLSTSLESKVFRKDFLIENFIRVKENLSTKGAEIIFVAECTQYTDNQAAIKQSFALQSHETPEDSPPSHWEDDFKNYRDALNKLLGGVKNEAQKNNLMFRFVKRYWQ